MARKAQNQELSEMPEGEMEEAGQEQPAVPTAPIPMEPIPMVRQEELGTAGPGVGQPAMVVSEVDRSLLSSQSPLLSRQQLKDLRGKLKTKFH
jgi:hypothetical protein